MKLKRKNLDGMTLVEVLVSMTIFAFMFAMVMGVMIVSVKINAGTQVYDQEIDKQVEDAERYNPMGAYISGIATGSNNVENYYLSTNDNGTVTAGSGGNNVNLNFIFSGGTTIQVPAYSYQVKSYNESNGMGLKFFSSTRPDTANEKYWVRVINVSEDENPEETFTLYIPKASTSTEKTGYFYQKNDAVANTSSYSKVLDKYEVLSVGFSAKDIDVATWFYLTTNTGERPVDDGLMTQINGYFKLTEGTSGSWLSSDGYIDFYYIGEATKEKLNNDKGQHLQSAYVNATEYQSLVEQGYIGGETE